MKRRGRRTQSESRRRKTPSESSVWLILAAVVVVAAFSAGLFQQFTGQAGWNPMCADSDGQDRYTQGTVVATDGFGGGSQTFVDYCADPQHPDGSTEVIEFYCAKRLVKSSPMGCPPGVYCVNGACPDESPYKQP